MNVIWTDDAVRVFDSVDVAIAVATDDVIRPRSSAQRMHSPSSSSPAAEFDRRGRSDPHGAGARNGRIEVAAVMTLTVSVDHRPVDGVVAARWLRRLVQLLENPVRLLR